MSHTLTGLLPGNTLVATVISIDFTTAIPLGMNVAMLSLSYVYGYKYKNTFHETKWDRDGK